MTRRELIESKIYLKKQMIFILWKELKALEALLKKEEENH
jgi:hypothetical protein